MPKGKTKKQLLAAMRNNSRCACDGAWHWVASHPSESALMIGRTCRHKSWLIWLLYRVLTVQGRALFAYRLGCDDDELWYAGMLTCDAYDLSRAVIDDCWRAWCRSGRKGGA